MTIERKELLDCSAESHRRIAELEAENRALRECAEKAETAAAERLRIIHKYTNCPSDPEWVNAVSSNCGQGWCSPEEKANLEAACAEMRKMIPDLWYYSSDDCPLSQAQIDRVLSSNRGQSLLDRMRAMEEILNDLSHRSIHGFDHRIKSDCGCVSNCPACQWEKLKEAKP